MSDGNSIDPRRIEILDAAVVEVLRRKTPVQRLAMAFDAERTMRKMLEAHFHAKYPEWDEKRIAEEIARRRNLGTS